MSDATKYDVFRTINPLMQEVEGVKESLLGLHAEHEQKQLQLQELLSTLDGMLMHKPRNREPDFHTATKHGIQRLVDYYFKADRPLTEYIDRKIAKLDNILTNWNTIDEEELFDDGASSLYSVGSEARDSDMDEPSASLLEQLPLLDGETLHCRTVGIYRRHIVSAPPTAATSTTRTVGIETDVGEIVMLDIFHQAQSRRPEAEIAALEGRRVCVTAIRHSHTPREKTKDDVLSLITPYLGDIQDIVCVDA